MDRWLFASIESGGANNYSVTKIIAYKTTNSVEILHSECKFYRSFGEAIEKYNLNNV